MKIKSTIGSIALLTAAFACQNGEDLQRLKPVDDAPVFMTLPEMRENPSGREGLDVEIYSAEYITAEESGQIGRTLIFSNVGNKQLFPDFVPFVAPDGTSDMSFYIDQNRPSADLPVAVTTAAIGRAMQTWDDVTCSDLGLFEVPYDGHSTGYVSAAFGFGGSFGYTADVVHAGWLPAAFFDLLAPQGSTFILGVTFTLTFAGDADSDGRPDVAWREIYYNDTFPWNDGNHYDVETIALHEAGHGLSQEHFGKAFITESNGKLHFSPRAVMNAAYSGIQTEIEQTDKGGHCSNWANWPNN